MQLFPCPFCGLRDETEFTFGGEAGKARPEPAGAVSAEDWAGFLHLHANPKGASREIWVHNPCGEFFLMERNTATHAVGAGRSQRRNTVDAVPGLEGDASSDTGGGQATFTVEARS